MTKLGHPSLGVACCAALCWAIPSVALAAVLLFRARRRGAATCVAASTLLGLCIGLSNSAQAVTINTVPVGNPGNAADTTGYGAVGYDYRIGTTEVTNTQYVEFLNAKAASDSLGLYNTNMGSSARGGITRSGSGTLVDPYAYTTKANMGDKPVNYVDWYDSIRFANWLNNGQGTGNTETGAYTLLGGTEVPSNGQSISRNVGATWFLPSEDEWYKAAYYQPATEGGDADNYWLYPTASNTAPTVATADSVGNISNPGTNVANYLSGADWNSQNGNLTTVGSAGPLSNSFYGTADQGGNVWEWNEAVTYSTIFARGWRGGAFFDVADNLQSSARLINGYPTSEFFRTGFRVATVPEPSTAVLAILGLAAVLLFRTRRHGLVTCVVASTLLGLCIGLSNSTQAVTINTVPVGDAGNANDPATGNVYGGVAYNYRIGTTEVTVGQYTDFLNAVAAADTYALYNPSMATDLNIAGISRSGASGNYSYSVIGSANHPVTYVSWGDAARFSNWLQNGQPTGAEGPGTTETGAYSLNGATSSTALNAITRNSGATWFIPSESEWYKAAYYQPAAQGGDADNYWLYPTGTNSTPYSDQSPGSGAPTPSNTGNFYANDSLANGYNNGYAVTGSTSYSSTQDYLTDAGAYSSSSSFYGTYDQGGNVWEWNEALISGSSRGERGGSFSFTSYYLQSSTRYNGNPAGEGISFGFRVATVPEPSTLVLAACGSIALLAVARPHRRATRAHHPTDRCHPGVRP